MTTPAAPPAAIMAALYRDARGAHTVVKLYADDNHRDPIAVHLVHLVLDQTSSIEWLADHGWEALTYVATEPDGVLMVPVARTAEAARTDAEAARALERVRADIVHRQGADGPEFLVEFLATNGDTDGATAVELARLALQAREAADEDGAYEDAFGDGFDRD